MLGTNPESAHRKFAQSRTRTATRVRSWILSVTLVTPQTQERVASCIVQVCIVSTDKAKEKEKQIWNDVQESLNFTWQRLVKEKDSIIQTDSIRSRWNKNATQYVISIRSSFPGTLSFRISITVQEMSKVNIEKRFAASAERCYSMWTDLVYKQIGYETCIRPLEVCREQDPDSYLSGKLAFVGDPCNHENDRQ
ncbi:hypothetical protein DPMN_052703 [Dreissena polymorpha]|uniref:Uncharacterized protein n=1 Tax=Dreissena polymorpha TaxID=45954 RepID=A0A9D4CLZ9_DREPO|nr:hypothetical protein DPMN_052703 [Dreissena polymorpha]